MADRNYLLRDDQRYGRDFVSLYSISVDQSAGHRSSADLAGPVRCEAQTASGWNGIKLPARKNLAEKVEWKDLSHSNKNEHNTVYIPPI